MSKKWNAPRPCESCHKTYTPAKDGGTKKLCDLCYRRPGSTSIRTVSGGLPTLGKRAR